MPRATVRGMLAVLAIYALVNVGYFHALPFDCGRGRRAPSRRRAARDVPRRRAQLVLALAMALSAISAMNGSMLTSARVPYAVAPRWPRAGGSRGCRRRARAGRRRSLVQGGVACVTRIRHFDELTDAVVFVSWLFYALTR